MQVATPKKGYKLVKTSFGKYEEIPEEWEVTKLGELIQFGNQGVNTAIDFVEYVEQGYPLIKAGDIRGDFNLEKTDKISKKSFDKIPDHQKPKLNDILFANIGSQLGSVFLVNFHDPVSIAWNVFLIRSNDTVNSCFLTYFLKKNSIQNRIKQISTKSTMPFIQKSHLLSVSISLPSLPEQKQITSILSNVDDTIQKTDQIIEQTQRLKKGMMQKLLTRGIGHTKFKKTQIGEISVEWNVSEIGKEFIVGSGATPKRERKEYYDGNIPWVKTTEIDYKLITSTEESITELGLKNSSVTKYPVGTLLVAMYGQGKTRGKCAILGIEATTNQACAGLQPKKTVNTKFIYYFLENSYEKIRIGQGSGQPNLTVGLVQKLVIPLPPLSEQQQIASILSNIDTQIQKEKLHKSNLERLKKGLMQKLLTGQIRVKVP